MQGAVHRENRDYYAAGVKLAASADYAAAIENFEVALRAQPDDPKVLFAIGNTARALGENSVAENFFRRVLAVAPHQTEALVNLANLMRETGRPQEAIAVLQPEIAIAQNIPELWVTLGSAVRETGDTERAAIFYREALRLRPSYPQALGNLADLLADDGLVDEAIAAYDQVIKAAAQDPQARLNRAILHLVKGDLGRGWRDYEYRLRTQRAAVSTHGLPRWNGKWPKELKLVVTGEQGIGDQIAFASVLPDLSADAQRAGGSIAIDVEPRLVSLFARSFPKITVHPSRTTREGGRNIAHYEWLRRGDAQMAIPLGSIPQLYRRELADFTMLNAYLVADAEEQMRWQSYFAQYASPTIGLCWRSGNLAGLRAQQFAPLEAWAAFARNAPGTLVSLQYDARPEEITALSEMCGRPVITPPALDQKLEIDRSAAMLSCLDYVVSAPTAVSWMSAALGVRTFKILFNNSWTALGQDYEPFAPACRTLIPSRRGDWSDSFAQVRNLLMTG